MQHPYLRNSKTQTIAASVSKESFSTAQVMPFLLRRIKEEALMDLL